MKRITGGRGVDVALDAVGGDSFRKSYRSLAPLGRLYVFGASSMATGARRSVMAAVGGLIRMPRFHPLAMMSSNRGVHGVNLGHLWNRADLLARMLGEIMERVSDGTFAPVVDRAFPLERAGEAHAYIQERRNFGKVLLTP